MLSVETHTDDETGGDSVREDHSRPWTLRLFLFQLCHAKQSLVDTMNCIISDLVFAFHFEQRELNTTVI